VRRFYGKLSAQNFFLEGVAVYPRQYLALFDDLSGLLVGYLVAALPEQADDRGFADGWTARNYDKNCPALSALPRAGPCRRLLTSKVCLLPASYST